MWKRKIFAASLPISAAADLWSSSSSVMADFLANSNRSISDGMSASSIGLRATRSDRASSMTKTRPMTIPGETAMPVIRCMKLGCPLGLVCRFGLFGHNNNGSTSAACAPGAGFVGLCVVGRVECSIEPFLLAMHDLAHPRGIGCLSHP